MLEKIPRDNPRKDKPISQWMHEWEHNWERIPVEDKDNGMSFCGYSHPSYATTDDFQASLSYEWSSINEPGH